MELNIDCTPYLVNKTAIHRIIDDFCQQQPEGKFVRFSVLNHKFKSWREFQAKASIPLLFHLAIRFPLVIYLLLEIKGLIMRRPSKSRTLFFDPLYVLFKSNIENDVVLVLDTSPLTIPTFHPKKISFLYQRAFLKITRSRCQILTISDSTLQDLRVNLGIADERMTKVRLYPGLKEDKSEAPPAALQKLLHNKYFLFVGSLEQRKNLRGAIDGFFASGLAEKGYFLYVVGGHGHGSAKILERLHRVKNVLWLGALPDYELQHVYKNACAFVYPSFWEGFGVPLLEALEKNIICAATETAACREVGEGAVITLDPCDTNSIAAAYHRCLTLGDEEREQLFEAGRKKLIEYTFNHFLTDMTMALKENESV